MTVDLSSTGLAKLQRIHRRRKGRPPYTCSADGGTWPCLDSLLLTELVRLRTEHDAATAHLRRIWGFLDGAFVGLIQAQSVAEQGFVPAAALVPVQHPTEEQP